MPPRAKKLKRILPQKLIEKHELLRERIGERKLQIAKHQEHLARQRGDYDYLPTASKASITQFGREFEKRFATHTIKGPAGRSYAVRTGNGHYESLLCVQAIEFGAYEKASIGWINIGFEKNALIVESMQTRRELHNRLNEFRRLTKQHTLDYLLEKTEHAAKELGFKEIKIRAPETLPYFLRPVLVGSETPKGIQRGIKILYQKIALRHGYKRDGYFFVKQLNAQGL